MADDNIVPDTFFENNNRDGIPLFDDLAKMMFPPFEETPENVAQNSTFPAFPITAQSIIEAMSSDTYSDYGLSDFSACVDDLAITNM